MTLFLKRGVVRGAGQGNASPRFVGCHDSTGCWAREKDLGLGGGAFMLSQGFPSVRSQMRPYHTKWKSSTASTAPRASGAFGSTGLDWTDSTGWTGDWPRRCLGLRLCCAFLRQVLLEAFPGFSTVSSPHPSVLLPLPGPGDCAPFLSVAPSPAFGLSLVSERPEDALS